MARLGRPSTDDGLSVVYFTLGNPMLPPTLLCAQMIRDGGIDAMAALNDALAKAIVGLAPHVQADIKRAFGRAMGEVVTEIINPAIAAYPELAPDDATWGAIARVRAAERSIGA